MPHACPNCHIDIDRDNIDHHLVCRIRTRKEITARHDNIVKLVTAYANNAGGVAISEPTHLDASSRLRPDISVHLADRTTLVDVAVIHPTAASHIDKAAQGSLAATVSRSNEKRRKYAAICSQYRARFVPFLMESYGGMSRAALDFLGSITAFGNANQQSNALPLSGLSALADIAIAVQRSNAMAARSCYMVASAC